MFVPLCLKFAGHRWRAFSWLNLPGILLQFPTPKVALNVKVRLNSLGQCFNFDMARSGIFILVFPYQPCKVCSYLCLIQYCIPFSPVFTAQLLVSMSWVSIAWNMSFTLEPISYRSFVKKRRHEKASSIKLSAISTVLNLRRTLAAARTMAANSNVLNSSMERDFVLS